jgi:hypothetical protein
MTNLVVLTATLLDDFSMSRMQVDFLHREHTERCMSWIERGASCRPNVAEDFGGPAVENQVDVLVDVDVIAKIKMTSVASQVGLSDNESKSNQCRLHMALASFDMVHSMT